MNKEEDIKKLEDIICIVCKGKSPTHTEIIEKIKFYWASVFPDEKYTQDDLNEIVDYVEYNIPISCPEPDILVDSNTKSDWLTDELRKNNKEFFWRRYRQYLRSQDFPEESIDRIEDDSRKILAFSANPNASYADKKRGLAVGDVQSGKTANYTALINLACDYGYKIIVLLAGLTDSLREQTQARIDNGFIGALSETIGGQIAYIGVGEEKEKYYAVPLTNTKNDFIKFIKENQNTTPEAYSKPLILVVKKNGNILKQVQEWLQPGKNKINSSNILIIDDEADNASVNTKRDEDNPTIINKYIRKLFDNFKIATYVGYTATPFANIFINPDNNPDLENLFPSDFIVQLKTPSNYFGAKKVFAPTKRYIRILDENEKDFLLPTHKKTDHFSVLPDSLKEAVCAFLLGCTVRTLRKQGKKHRSMLINISRFNALHEDIRVQVAGYVDYLKDFIEQDSYKTTNDFVKYNEGNRLYQIYTQSNFFKEALQKYSFEDVKKHLLEEIKQFQVVVINNANTKCRFKYSDYKDSGARVIVIGGFVLSRGLTLEGLMVSYYSRNSKTYDSLLQMCRWFGYRPFYEDICILYISQINVDNFGAVIDAIDDLKEQFARMAKAGACPRTFGLMVKESPDSLATAIMVTSANKMYHTKTLPYYITYGGEVADTSKIAFDHNANIASEKLCHELFSLLVKQGYELQKISNRLMFKNIPKDIIANFVKSLKVHIENIKFNTQCLSDFIFQSQLFLNWDIVIATGESNKKWFFLGQTINIPKRTSVHRPGEDFIRIAERNNRLIDPGLLNSGLTQNDIDRLTQLLGHPPTSSVDYLALENRNPLLIIYPVDAVTDGSSIVDWIFMGFAVAFPAKGKSEKVAYRMNKIKYAELANILDDRDEDEELNNA